MIRNRTFKGGKLKGKKKKEKQNKEKQKREKQKRDKLRNKMRDIISVLTKRRKNKNRKKVLSQARRRPSILLSQPRKKRMTLHIVRKKPHIRSMSFSDSSMFSSGTGMKPMYKRRAMMNEQVDDMNRGAFMLQDNDRVMLGRYPN